MFLMSIELSSLLYIASHAKGCLGIIKNEIIVSQGELSGRDLTDEGAPRLNAPAQKRLPLAAPARIRQRTSE